MRAIVLLLLAGPAFGADAREVGLGVEHLHFQTTATPLNRGNALGLGDEVWYLRGTLAWRETHGPFRAALRGLVERTGGLADDDTEIIGREAYVQWSGVAGSVRVGKQRTTWGTGFAWNPTSRLEPPKNALNTSLEQQGVWAVRGEWTPTAQVTFTALGARVETQPGDLPLELASPARHGAAARAAFLVGNTDLALVASIQEERRPLVGVDAARSLFGNVTAHAEASIYHGSELAPARSDMFVRVAAGLLYTRGEQAFAVEYFHNGEGYRDPERRDWLAALDASYAASVDPRLPEPTREAARTAYYAGVLRAYQGLGLGRNYVHASWSHTRVAGEWGLSLRGVGSLTDGGIALTPGVSYAPSGRVTISTDGLLLLGPGDSEYRLTPARRGLITRVKVLF